MKRAKARLDKVHHLLPLEFLISSSVAAANRHLTANLLSRFSRFVPGSVPSPSTTTVSFSPLPFPLHSPTLASALHNILLPSLPTSP